MVLRISLKCYSIWYYKPPHFSQHSDNSNQHFSNPPPYSIHTLLSSSFFCLENTLPLSVIKLMLLLLSRFSRVWLCATPQMAVHQAPPSLGFSRQEHWSGLPFPSPMHESEKWKWSRSVLSCSLATPWTAAHWAPPSMRFFQARILEWGAIAFSI